MIRSSLVTALVFMATPSAGLVAQAPDFRAIDSTVTAMLEASRIPGAALVIVHDDQIVHVRGFGMADGTRPVTPTTPFFLGSTAKTFTALAVMQLVDSGKIDLDAPVVRYLPWFRLADSAPSAAITVRQLVNHTSGIPESSCSQFLADNDTDPASEERQVRWLATVTAKSAPGVKFDYCNLNFVVAGLVVRAVSGLSLAEYLQQRVFAPLEMHHSFTERADALRDGLAQGYQFALGWPFASNMPPNRGGLAHGYLISSAEDFGHYLIAQLNEGRYLDRQILSPAAMAVHHRGTVPVVPGRTVAISWMAVDFKGTTILDHGGSAPAYQSRLIMFPKERWGVGLLANGDGGPSDTYFNGAAEQVAALVIGATPDPILYRWVYPALFAAFAVVPVLILVGVWRGVRRLGRWQRDPASRPAPGRRRWVGVALPPALSVLGGGFLVFGLPALFGSPLRVMQVFQPDAGWMVTVAGYLGLVWGVVSLGIGWRTVGGAAPRTN